MISVIGAMDISSDVCYPSALRIAQRKAAMGFAIISGQIKKLLSRLNL